jgi:hypothetical protein
MTEIIREHDTTARHTTVWPRVRFGFAALYAAGFLIHVGLALFRPTAYRPFADESPFGWVRDGWHDVFLAEPRLWALLLAAGELAIAVALLVRPRIGYLAVAGFTVALALFGWGFLTWCVPALIVVLLSMLREERTP